jgi:hypothetical protein
MWPVNQAWDYNGWNGNSFKWISLSNICLTTSRICCPTWLFTHTSVKSLARVRHLVTPRLTWDHTSTFSPFNFRFNQILNVETSIIHYNTVMCTDSTDHTVFCAFGNVIPSDEETYVKDLSEIWLGMLGLSTWSNLHIQSLAREGQSSIVPPTSSALQVGCQQGSLEINWGSPSDSTCQNNAILLAFVSWLWKFSSSCLM